MSENETLVLTIVAISIPIALFAFFAFIIWNGVFRGGKERREKKEKKAADLALRRQSAIESTAKVLTSEPIGLRPVVDQHGFGQYRDVRLCLEVTPPGGTQAPAYEAHVLWDVQVLALSNVAPGAAVAVLVDSDAPSRVYPKEGWARTTL